MTDPVSSILLALVLSQLLAMVSILKVSAQRRPAHLHRLLGPFGGRVLPAC